MSDSTPEHTPVTEDIRLAYVDRQDFIAQVARLERQDDEFYEAEFDRWLESVKTVTYNDGARSQATFNANVLKAERTTAWDEGEKAGRYNNRAWIDETLLTNPHREEGE